MHPRFSIATVVVVAFTASIAGVQASPINIGANFTFSTTAGMTASPCGTTCTINDPSGSNSGNGVLSSNFSVSGDFTVQVTQSAGMNGSPEFDVGFEVGFAGGNETNQFVRINSFGQPVPPEWGASLNYTSGPPTVFSDVVVGSASVQLELQRIGDTVSLFFNNSLLVSDTGADYLGAATFALVASSSASSGGSATWENLTVDTAATPIPAALPLFASGLGALGLLGWRGKRKPLPLQPDQNT